MKNQFECILENAKLLQSVNYSVLTFSDIETIASKAGIGNSLLPDLYCFLRENGVEILSEDEAASILKIKKEDQAQNYRIKKFMQADEGLERLLAADMEEQRRQAWIKLIEQSKDLAAVFVLKQQGRSASEIAVALDLPVEEIYRRQYCICQRLRMVGHSHKSAKQIKDYYV